MPSAPEFGKAESCRSARAIDGGEPVECLDDVVGDP
jgi:hypothetical protein